MRRISFGLAALAFAVASSAQTSSKLDPANADGGASPLSAMQLPAVQNLSSKGLLGCTLVLCFANPGGPWAAGEACVDAMKERARLLARGKTVPSCPALNTSSQGGSSGSAGGLIRDDRLIDKLQQN